MNCWLLCTTTTDVSGQIFILYTLKLAQATHQAALHELPNEYRNNRINRPFPFIRFLHFALTTKRLAQIILLSPPTHYYNYTLRLRGWQHFSPHLPIVEYLKRSFGWSPLVDWERCALETKGYKVKTHVI